MHTTKRRLLAFAVALITATGFALVGGGAAQAAGPGSTTCSGGLAPGMYRNVEVAGFCNLDPSATIQGNVTVDPGAVLLMVQPGVQIGGNVSVGAGAVFAGFAGPSVAGNLTANGARALYLLSGSVGGNLTFTGGGSGRDCTDPDPNSSFGMDTMVKDSTIGKNVTFTGWAGCWFGFLRNTVTRNVTISNMYANPANVNFPGTPDQTFQGLDSTEIANNMVGGILSCTGNTPAAQFGDSGGGPNTARMALGECAALT